MTVDGVHSTGTTDGDGYRDCEDPSDASQVTIRLQDGKQICVYEFALGSLDPLDADSGSKQRLSSLGFAAKDDIAGIIRAFQASQNIPVTGQVDDATGQIEGAIRAMSRMPLTRQLSGDTGHDTVDVPVAKIFFQKSPAKPDGDTRGSKGLTGR